MLLPPVISSGPQAISVHKYHRSFAVSSLEIQISQEQKKSSGNTEIIKALIEICFNERDDLRRGDVEEGDYRSTDADRRQKQKKEASRGPLTDTVPA